MKVLHLTLKKKWFDMIASGEKKEEYREYNEYWKKRFQIIGTHPPVYKKFDAIKFTNGYLKTSPTIIIECEMILATFGKEEWGGDPRNLQFVIKLGKILK